MACECAANCKADIAAKQVVYLNLINTLNEASVTSDKSQIFTYIMDDINRLRSISKRMEDMQASVSAEAAIPSTGYMSPSVQYGILQELIKIRAVSEADYTTLSAILGVSIPPQEIVEV